VVLNGAIPQIDRVNGEVNCQIQVTAIPADRVKNPQNQTLSFNFNYVYPTQVTNNTTEPGSLVIVQETNSGELPNFSGDNYYNIKKGPGGYITLKFSCTNLVQKGQFKLISEPGAIIQQITITNNSDTKYTNLIETSAIGKFQASVDYTSNDLTVTLPNSSSPTLVNTAAKSPIITLS